MVYDVSRECRECHMVYDASRECRECHMVYYVSRECRECHMVYDVSREYLPDLYSSRPLQFQTFTVPDLYSSTLIVTKTSRRLLQLRTTTYTTWAPTMTDIIRKICRAGWGTNAVAFHAPLTYSRVRCSKDDTSALINSIPSARNVLTIETDTAGSPDRLSETNGWTNVQTDGPVIHLTTSA
ncbi:hypothetical protein Btru_009725 [Bulinus truncatus]|nr:hypothetical protein Btru_009725 [Bulinus truncatus]